MALVAKHVQQSPEKILMLLNGREANSPKDFCYILEYLASSQEVGCSFSWSKIKRDGSPDFSDIEQWFNTSSLHLYDKYFFLWLLLRDNTNKDLKPLYNMLLSHFNGDFERMVGSFNAGAYQGYLLSLAIYYGPKLSPAYRLLLSLATLPHLHDMVANTHHEQRMFSAGVLYRLFPSTQIHGIFAFDYMTPEMRTSAAQVFISGMADELFTKISNTRIAEDALELCPAEWKPMVIRGGSKIVSSSFKETRVVPMIEALYTSIRKEHPGSGIGLITAAPHGTLGDVMASVKMLKNLSRQSDRPLYWFICVIQPSPKLQSIIASLQEQIEVKVFVETTWHTLLRQFKLNKDNLLGVASFPTCAWLPRYFQNAIGSDGTSALNLHEYDLHHSPKEYSIGPGLASSGVGFLSEFQGVFCETSKVNMALQERIEKQQSKTQKVFFAYTNKYLAAEMSPPERVGKTRLSVFIEAVSLFAQKRKIEKIALISRDPGPESPPDATPKVKYHTPFPMQPDNFAAYLRASHWFTCVTGDQSFIEALLLGKVVYYQPMSWKASLYNSFCRSLGRGGIAGKIPHLEDFYKRVLNISPEEIADLLDKHAQALVDEAGILAKYLKKHCNLERQISLIIKTLSSKEPLPKWENPEGFVWKPLEGAPRDRVEDDEKESDDNVAASFVNLFFSECTKDLAHHDFRVTSSKTIEWLRKEFRSDKEEQSDVEHKSATIATVAVQKQGLPKQAPWLMQSQVRPGPYADQYRQRPKDR